jgi:hypothetical protein
VDLHGDPPLVPRPSGSAALSPDQIEAPAPGSPFPATPARAGNPSSSTARSHSKAPPELGIAGRGWTSAPDFPSCGSDLLAH